MCLNSLIVVLVTHYDIVKDNNAVCKGIIPFETLLALSPLSLLKQQNLLTKVNSYFNKINK